MKYGYVPTDLERSRVETVEYAFDWTIARMAERWVNRYRQKFYGRAQYYPNVFDVKTGFIRARKAMVNSRAIQSSGLQFW